MPVLAKIDGGYRDVSNRYVNIGGVWRTSDPPKININGTWRNTWFSSKTSLTELTWNRTTTGPVVNATGNVASAETGLIGVNLYAAINGGNSGTNTITFESFDFSNWKYLVLSGFARAHTTGDNPSYETVAVLNNVAFAQRNTPGTTYRSFNLEKIPLSDIGISGVGILKFEVRLNCAPGYTATGEWSLYSVGLSN